MQSFLPRRVRLALACVAAMHVATVSAQATPPIAPTISAPVEATFQRVLAAAAVKSALAAIEADDDRTLRDQIELTEIPAPPFNEAVRAAEYAKRLQVRGFTEARVDKKRNVIAVGKGSGNGPLLIVAAHQDTVFPEDTDVKVKPQGERYYAPGIYDDGRGLAALLSVVRARNATQIKTVGDVWFVGTVGEEELGDLRGVTSTCAPTALPN